MDMTAHDRLLTKIELAKQVFGVSENTVEDIINEPGFPFVMIGKRKKYSVRAVDQWIEDHIEREKHY